MDDVELIGGPERRTIVIVAYDPTWPARFDLHRRRITDVLGAAACRVDHIGATAKDLTPRRLARSMAVRDQKP